MEEKNVKQRVYLRRLLIIAIILLIIIIVGIVMYNVAREPESKTKEQIQETYLSLKFSEISYISSNLEEKFNIKILIVMDKNGKIIDTRYSERGEKDKIEKKYNKLVNDAGTIYTNIQLKDNILYYNNAMWNTQIEEFIINSLKNWEDFRYQEL